jgi:hypothetical protein
MFVILTDGSFFFQGTEHDTKESLQVIFDDITLESYRINYDLN